MKITKNKGKATLSSGFSKEGGVLWVTEIFPFGPGLWAASGIEKGTGHLKNTAGDETRTVRYSANAGR